MASERRNVLPEQEAGDDENSGLNEFEFLDILGAGVVPLHGLHFVLWSVVPHPGFIPMPMDMRKASAHDHDGMGPRWRNATWKGIGNPDIEMEPSTSRPATSLPVPPRVVRMLSFKSIVTGDECRTTTHRTRDGRHPGVDDYCRYDLYTSNPSDSPSPTTIMLLNIVRFKVLLLEAYIFPSGVSARGSNLLGVSRRTRGRAEASGDIQSSTNMRVGEEEMEALTPQCSNTNGAQKIFRGRGTATSGRRDLVTGDWVGSKSQGRHSLYLPAENYAPIVSKWNTMEHNKRRELDTSCGVLGFGHDRHRGWQTAPGTQDEASLRTLTSAQWTTRQFAQQAVRQPSSQSRLSKDVGLPSPHEYSAPHFYTERQNVSISLRLDPNRDCKGDIMVRWSLKRNSLRSRTSKVKIVRRPKAPLFSDSLGGFTIATAIKTAPLKMAIKRNLFGPTNSEREPNDRELDAESTREAIRRKAVPSRRCPLRKTRHPEKTTAEAHEICSERLIVVGEMTCKKYIRVAVCVGTYLDVAVSEAGLKLVNHDRGQWGRTPRLGGPCEEPTGGEVGVQATDGLKAGPQLTPSGPPLAPLPTLRLLPTGNRLPHGPSLATISN
ncbi:hypothetical protein AAG570_010759 [Ranatra chinensis]|uniref:Uncharacterized protein n=1 Tax=Ranatra chinensis TaxID=642074 RepID=A0ABD0YZE2_9HEMI